MQANPLGSRTIVGSGDGIVPVDIKAGADAACPRAIIDSGGPTDGKACTKGCAVGGVWI